MCNVDIHFAVNKHEDKTLLYLYRAVFLRGFSRFLLHVECLCSRLFQDLNESGPLSVVGYFIHIRPGIKRFTRAKVTSGQRVVIYSRLQITLLLPRRAIENQRLSRAADSLELNH